MTQSKKKVIICFYKGDISKDISILDDLDLKGFEVHLFNDIDETNLKCDILPSIVKDLCINKEYQYDIYVSSNVKNFIMLQYILYKDWISAALYLNNNPVNFQLEKLYQLILSENSNINSANFYVLKKEDSMFSSCHIFDGNFKIYTYDKPYENAIYNFRGITHIFSISNNENINIINLDNFKNRNVYNYHINLDYLDEYLQFILHYSESVSEFIESYSSIYLKIDEFKNKILYLSNFEKRIVRFKLENELNKSKSKDTYKVFLSSILLKIFNDKRYLEYLMNVSITSKSINRYSKFFIYYQCVRYIFVNKNIINESTSRMIETLYYNVFKDFSDLTSKYKYISKEKRNKQLVFVFTTQFLDVNHSPTKLALDICYNLAKVLNKKVTLINTKEVLTCKGLIPMADIVNANVLENFSNFNAINYKDISIPFYQPSVSMPDEEVIIKILNMVAEYKPELIINIGTCLVGDLCTSIVPTITRPLGEYGYSKSTFYIVSNKNTYEYYVKNRSRDKRSLIIIEDTFELKSKNNDFTKKQLGIPEGKFIISVIGIRLDEEIDEEFLGVLEESCRICNAYILFIDKFDFNKYHVNKYKHLINNYKNMGYQQDLLAVLEHTNIYVNPKRSGGGTSAIYAMYMGKPVITFANCDVAESSGKEFCVNNYNEMIDKICRYWNDIEFYKKQGYIAKERALEITNMSMYVKKLHKKVIENPLF